MDTSPAPARGQIVTFYSYKGGVGRSMALANTAFLLGQSLARQSQKVLMIDWDLEAPGLHRYFPLSDSPEHKTRPGLIDYFWNLSQSMNDSLYQEICERNYSSEAGNIVSLKKYIVPDVAPGVDFVRAGYFDVNYPERVAAFDWIKFYRDYRLVFRALREIIAREYQWCLIDSRTGLSDVSGISSMLMPEKLVTMFTLNRQSVDGVLDLVERAIEYRRKSEDPRPLSVFPLPSRIVVEELELLKTARQSYRERFENCMRRVYGVESCDLSEYFDQVEIPHQGFYAFNESVPARDDPGTTAVASINKAYERFFKRLVTLGFAWESLEDARQAEKGGAGLVPPVRPLPPGSRMPHAPNSLFSGRDNDLQQLASTLGPGRSSAVLAVSGLGGIGKTQLAIEYAHRYGANYPAGVFWLNMSNAEEAMVEVARCGGPEGMNLPEFNSLKIFDQASLVVRRWAEEELPSLIIFDDAQEPNLIERWRPKTGKSSILITSRRSDWPPELVEKSVPLHVLPREASIRLLAEARPSILINSTDREIANTICEMLGDLPLALMVAASYLRRYKAESLKEYLAALQQGPAIQDASFNQVLVTSFKLSYRGLEEKNERDSLAKNLFYLASYFAQASISRELLAAAAGLDYSQRREKLRVEDAYARLLELGLISEDDEARLRLHRLLREFARLNPPPDALDTNPAVSIAKVLLRFAESENATGLPQKLLRERQHLRESALSVERIDPELSAGLFSELGVHGMRVAFWHEAKADFEYALKIDETTFGPDHPKVARDLNNLGTLLLDLADFASARSLLERALKIDEAALGPEHPAIATDLNSLGYLLRNSGDLTGSRASFERALKINEATYGSEHPSISSDLNNLGTVLRELGDLAGARANFERALKTDEAVLGPDHPNTARDVNNLGIVLQDLGDLAGARANFERALKIDEAVLGPDHPSTARDVNNLGMVLQDLGDTAGSRASFERALKILANSLGAKHPFTQRVQKRLQELTARK